MDNTHARASIDPTARARRAYLQSRVQGADTQDLLVMLYEGLLQNVIAGERCLEAEDWEGANEALGKARRIVTYLSNSLRDEGGEISGHLRRLCTFCFENIGRANLEKNPSRLAGVLAVLRELSGAWSNLAKKQGAGAESTGTEGE